MEFFPTFFLLDSLEKKEEGNCVSNGGI